MSVIEGGQEPLKPLVKELRSTLARMELALATVDEAIAWTDRQGVILWCNAVFDQLVMRPHILVVGNVITEIFPLFTEDATPCLHHPFQRAMESRVKGRKHYYFQRGEQIKYLEVTWAYFQEHLDGSEEIGCVLTIRDMTEWQRLDLERQTSQTLLQKQNLALQQTQTELRRVERSNQELRLLETLLDVALAGYWDWNLITGEEYLSPTFKRMFGYEDHELPNVSTTWQTLIFAEDMPKVDQTFAAHVQSRGQIPFYTEVRYRHKKGSTVWVICTGLVIDWDTEGNPLRAIGCHVDITEQKRTEDKLRTSLQEKEILLKEIHHRVKNNLLIVASLLNWQGESIQDPAILHLLADSQKRINAMALIHEKLYRSTDLTHINFGDYLQTLAEQIVASCSSDRYLIHFHYYLCSMTLNVETATPCGLIVNELILNALEHAFPAHQPGNLFFTLKQTTTGTIMLQIQDDGQGLPADFNFRKTQSLGWQLICLLTEQLEGDIQVNSQNGTQVTLTFRELNYRERF